MSFVSHFINPVFQQFHTDGRPLSGGKLYAWHAGTSTPRDLYQDAFKQVEHPHPVVLNERGEAIIYGDGLYKFSLYTPDDILLWTIDNIYLHTNSGIIEQILDALRIEQHKHSIQISDRYPAEQPDGVRTNFSTSRKFRAQTLMVYYNGVLQFPEQHYTEDSDLRGYTLTFVPKEDTNLQHFYLIDEEEDGLL